MSRFLMPRAVMSISSSGLDSSSAIEVVLAKVVVVAVLAGSGVFAVSELFFELFPLFPNALDAVSGKAVCLDDLFEGNAGIDLGWVLVRPVRFEGGVVPVVEWLLEVGDDPDDAVEDHLASGYAVAGPDGGVFWVGFVYVGQDGCELNSVVGDLEYVVLGLAGEVGDVAGCVGDVAGLVQPGRGSVPSLRLSRDLGRAEFVFELLLESCDGAVGCGRGGFRSGGV